MALTRFYVFHCVFLPSLLVALVAIHFHFLAQLGLSDLLGEGRASRGCIPLLPDLVNRWLVLFSAVAVVLGLVAGTPGQPGGSHGFLLHPQARVVGSGPESVGQNLQRALHVHRHRRHPGGLAA